MSTCLLTLIKLINLSDKLFLGNIRSICEKSRPLKGTSSEKDSPKTS
jgi:hypothetical protein